MKGPLDGISVLDVAIYAVAPSATAVLVDWGADVLKVEHPEVGDPGRMTVCVLIDRLDWLADDRHRMVLISMLDELFVERDVDLRPGEVQHDEQAIANVYVQRVEQDDNGKVVLVPAPAQFDGIVPTLGRAPGHGAHTDEVLEREGLDAETIADLRKRGVVR